MQSSAQTLDWPNQPLPFKIYTSLEPMPLSLAFEPSEASALSSIGGGVTGLVPRAMTDWSDAIARLAYFSNGVTRVLRGMAFRAAACTGALFHIELYLVTRDLGAVESGVYHYGAHDNALRQLRRGDFRRVLVDASGGEPALSAAPLTMVLTSTWWRNAWKYQARAYRHAFWDGGTVLANLLAVANGQAIPSEVVVGFADAAVNELLDVNPAKEAAIALVAIGAGAEPPPISPPMPRLNLSTRPLSAHEVDYPEITAAHTASSLADGAAAAAWRGNFPLESRVAGQGFDGDQSIEAVILRRGSSRRFSHAAISRAQLETMLAVATSPIPMDVHLTTDVYLIVNAVDGLPSGAYFYSRETGTLELLQRGDFRPQAAYLDLGQSLAGDAAFDAYWLVNLDPFDDRAYRAAQLTAAIEAGKLYLAAYSLGLGATGLTFFDDDVTHFFEPHAAGKSVLFLTAVGHPFKR
ncbi:MAG: SagB family peptide dehydrogenase [Chloroflexi bacterium]|nr:SagB family peptide dehydrogenase [Chloroflexota bacterium]